MFIMAHRIEQHNGRPFFNLYHLKLILDEIGTHCHQLRSLYLSFMVASLQDEMIGSPGLPLVDAFYRSMQLGSMRADLPYPSY
jgi:hypothetical protein